MKISAPDLAGAINALKGTADEIEKLSPMRLSSLDAAKTALVIVDMVNGFIYEGAMHSERIADIIPPSAALLEKCSETGIRAVAFADCHNETCAEFESFPPHCIRGTSESEIVPEIKNIGNYELIEKNSTNGFHEKKWTEYLAENNGLDTFIVIGDCTDICVMQFALALKTFFTMKDKSADIIIPVNCAETYDAPYHNADFTNIAAYKLMKDSGIRFVKEFIYDDKT